MQWAEQLKEEYSKIAKENQLSGLKNQNIVSTTLDERQFRTDKSVANDLDMGKTTYRKAKYIYENGNNNLIQQLDDEQLSINKIIVLIKHYVWSVVFFICLLRLTLDEPEKIRTNKIKLKESVRYEYINVYGYNNFSRCNNSNCYTE